MTELFLFLVVGALLVLLMGWLGRRLKWIPALLLILLVASQVTLAGDDLYYGWALFLLGAFLAAFVVGLIVGLVERRHALDN